MLFANKCSLTEYLNASRFHFTYRHHRLENAYVISPTRLALGVSQPSAFEDSSKSDTLSFFIMKQLYTLLLVGYINDI